MSANASSPTRGCTLRRLIAASAIALCILTACTTQQPKPRHAQPAPDNDTPYHTNTEWGYRIPLTGDWAFVHAAAYQYRFADSHTAVFELPAVWIEDERESIPTTIAVKSFHFDGPANLDTLIDGYLEADQGRISSNEPADPLHAAFPRAYVQQIEWYNKTYKTRFEAVTHGDFGYIIEYAATPDTYEANLDKYRQFLTNLEFLAKPATAPRSAPPPSAAP